MRRLFFLFLLSLSVAVAQAQSGEEIYRDFCDVKNVQATTTPKELVGLGAKAISDNNVKALLQQIDKVQVLNLDNCSKRNRKKLVKRVGKLADHGYKVITQMKDDDDIFQMLGKEADGKITEFVFLQADNEDCTFVMVKGHINKEDLNAVMGLVTNR
jgi:hypothetical protein